MFVGGEKDKKNIIDVAPDGEVSQVHSEEGLMLKTSALQLFRVANQHLINSVDRTKIVYSYSPTDAAPQFLQKLPSPHLNYIIYLGM